MAQTYKSGTFDRDDLVGVPESVAAGMADLRAAATPLLSAIAPNLDNLATPIASTVYSYFERQWRPMRTVLTSTLTAGVTTVVLTDPVAKAGELIAIDEEVILLVTDSGDSLTFTGCTRSIGTPADATHAAGASVLVLGKAHTIGSAAGTADMIVQPNQITNYTQIFKRDIGVSGTAAVLAEHHRVGRSRYDANLEEQMLNLKHELENSLVFSVAQAAVADSTAGRFDGIIERIYSGSGTDMSGATPTRDNIRTELRAVKDYGGEGLAKILFCSDYMKGVIDDWQLPHINHVAGSPMAKRFGANVQEVELGGELVPVVPMAKLKTHMLLLVPEFIRVGPLRGPNGSREFTHTLLGIDGDRTKGQLIGEYGVQVMAPKAQRLLYGCAAS